MSSFILEDFFVSGAEPTWWRWIQYTIMTKSQQSPGSRTRFKGWVGCWWICLKPLVMFQTFTLETAWLQPQGWRKCRFCSHTSQDKEHYGSESSLLLMILSAPPTHTTTTTHRPHPLHNLGDDKRAAGERQPTCSSNVIYPQLGPQHRATATVSPGGEIITPALKETDFQQPWRSFRCEE